MITKLSLQDPDRVEEIWLLQHKAFRLEASALGLRQIPVLPETLESLAVSSETFFGEISQEDDLLGAIAVHVESTDSLMITRLMIQPAHLRQGIGSRLLEYVLAQHPGIKRFRVYAGRGNEPATALYQKYGFRPVDSCTVDLGIELTLMQRDE